MTFELYEVVFFPQTKYRRIQFGDSDEEDEGREKSGRGDVPTHSGDTDGRHHVTTPMDEVFGASDDDDDGLLDTSGSMRDPFIDDDEVKGRKWALIGTWRAGIFNIVLILLESREEGKIRV